MPIVAPVIVAGIAIAVSVGTLLSSHFPLQVKRNNQTQPNSHRRQFIPEKRLRSTGLLVFQPDKFQGGGKTHRYFEGWYYKFVSNIDTTNITSGNSTGNTNNNDVYANDNEDAFSMAIVPGIFLGSSPTSDESHAFVFVTLNGKRQYYFRFGLDEFNYSTSDGKEEYFIQVGDNYFSHDGVSINLRPRQGYDFGVDGVSDDDFSSIILHGNLTFSNPSPWPVSLLGLGAMGPVGWMPGLECTHGILSFDHVLSGAFTLGNIRTNGDTFERDSVSLISMDRGRGYTEKDFGRSFPSLWVWIQSNSFRNNTGTSLFVSIARIPTPFFGLEFPGFTAAIWHDGVPIPFATWSGAKFEALEISKDRVFIAMRSHRRQHEYRVELEVDRRNVPEVLLYAPVNFTRMEPFVWEALQAKVHMRLFDRNGEVIIDDFGDYAGLEVHGDVNWLVENLCGKKTANKVICL